MLHSLTYRDSQVASVYPPLPKTRTVWAFGGGKGGTGKSFMAANLGIQLSSSQMETVLVDVDLGAPNLHTFLGIRDPHWTLADFLAKKVPSLADVVTPTPVEALKLIAGSNQRLYLANLAYSQKQKLIRHILALRSAHVLIDTGGGSSFNCIDFFPIADAGVLVINPNPASVENAYQFLRSVTLRILRFSIRRHGLEPLVAEAAELQGAVSESIDGLLRCVRVCDVRAAQLLEEELAGFHPYLIINKSRDEDDVVLGRSISQIAKRHLSINLTAIGAVPFDEKVESCLRQFSPFVRACPHSKAAYAISLIADRLLKCEAAWRTDSV